MSELVVRGHHNDHLVLAELLGPATLPMPTARLIRRIVVDATAAAGTRSSRGRHWTAAPSTSSTP